MLFTENKISINVAGYNYSFIAQDKLNMFIDPIYSNFLVSDKNTERVNISVRKGFPAEQMIHENIFEAKISESVDVNIPQRDWDIFEWSGSYYLRIFSSTSKNKIETIVKVNDTANWDLYFHEDLCADNVVDIVKHPIGSLILYYISALHGDIFLHCSGINDGKSGKIFTGFSGTGKSTIARIFEKNGSAVIHDDRLILRKIQNHWTMHNTPVYLNDFPKTSKIDEIFLIHHAPENLAEQLNGARAASRLYAYCIQHNFSEKIICKLLESVTDLCDKTNVFDVGFFPNEKIVEYINSL